MRAEFLFYIAAPVLLTGILSGCPWDGSSSSRGEAALTVNSLEDAVYPATADTITLREAVRRIRSGGTISFDPALSGGTIDLSIVGEEHSILKGEVFTLVLPPPPPPYWRYDGYQERDYGRSALYAAKNLTLDASDLPDGINLNWTGGEDDPARVLAVYGNLTMENVNISSGVASAVFLTSTFNAQQYTLARGAGVAVWGQARLTDCEISGNISKGEAAGSRDRGAFGGGIYGDVVILEGCVVSGNAVRGYGAAGGGIYSVGGWDSPGNSSITGSAVTGNSIAGLHTYGGGIFTEGGGRENPDLEPLVLTSTTVARNLVMHNPDIPAPDASTERYYRGGGVYMSNGYLWIDGCTITENVVTGYAATFHGEPNMSGGGVAATVGDAHVVEDMQIQQSILTGNTVDGTAGDLFTGSLVDFHSWGYNLFGDINFDFIHVPVPWWSLYMSRKHYPTQGDRESVDAHEVLDLDAIQYHPSIASMGVSPGQSVVLWYPPAGDALDTLPAAGYAVTYVKAGWLQSEPPGFLEDLLAEITLRYGVDYSEAFSDRDLSAITFYGPAYTWPDPDEHPENQPWILFWRDLDAAMAASPWPGMGVEKLADAFWSQPFASGDGPDVTSHTSPVSLIDTDQRGNPRPAGTTGDIGAIELP